jgi:hypothetical protein
VLKCWSIKEFRNTHKFVLHADDVNTSNGSTHTTNKNIKTVVVSSEEIGLEVNAKKSTCSYLETSKQDKIKISNI